MSRYIEPVPNQVRENVSKYLLEGKLGELIEVTRGSEHPSDAHLYHVIAKQNNKYACWTCWNEKSQSLNFGHYDLESIEQAREICQSFFYKVGG